MPVWKTLISTIGSIEMRCQYQEVGRDSEMGYPAINVPIISSIFNLLFRHCFVFVLYTLYLILSQPFTFFLGTFLIRYL